MSAPNTDTALIVNDYTTVIGATLPELITAIAAVPNGVAVGPVGIRFVNGQFFQLVITPHLS